MLPALIASGETSDPVNVYPFVTVTAEPVKVALLSLAVIVSPTAVTVKVIVIVAVL